MALGSFLFLKEQIKDIIIGDSGGHVLQETSRVSGLSSLHKAECPTVDDSESNQTYHKNDKKDDNLSLLHLFQVPKPWSVSVQVESDSCG